MSEPSRSQLATARIGPLLLAALFAAYAAWAGFICDDGYIAFQYARNFAAGEGLVYNVGERVEGYNCFLWLALLGIATRLLPGVEIPLLAQGLGAAFGAATILLVCRFSREICGERGALGLLAGAFLALHASFVPWSTAGLEAPMLAFLLVASTYAYVRFLRSGERPLLVPALFAAAALTRPDSLLFFGVTSLHFWAREVRAGRPVFGRRVLAWGLIFLAIFGTYYAARWAWYGYPLPNTVYAKVGAGREQLWLGLRYVQEYFRIYGVLVFAPPALLLLRRARTDWQDYFALMLAPYLAYLVWVGGDGLAFFRFFAYVAPLLYLLVQAGYVDLYRRAQRAVAPRRRPAVAVAAALLLAASLWTTTRQAALPLLWPAAARWEEPQAELAFPGDGRQHAYVWFDNYFVDRLAAAARWLDAHAPAGSTVASTPAGSIAYHMRHPVIDMLGLNDLHIARTEPGHVGWLRAGHRKGDGAYVLSREPDYILLGNVAVLHRPLSHREMESKLVRKSEHEIWGDPRFHRDYEHVAIRLADDGPFQWFTFYRRKGVRSAAEPGGST